ncbi:MAG: hypothetical protein V7744_10900 [Pseudomonadales bacterium]
MRKYLLIPLLMVTMVSVGFAASAEQKRQKTLQMRAEVLERLYKEELNTRDEVKSAVGYAVFSNIGVNVIFFSAGGGTGVAHNNKTGVNIFMNMGSAGVGLGLGLKDFRGVFIFHTSEAYNNFVDTGWDFSGQADAAAVSGDKGGEGSGVGSIVNGVTVYQLTETGLALQATLQGTKYWKDKKLN